jgi:hypothetical protein
MDKYPKLVVSAIKHGHKAGCRVTERKIMAVVAVEINGTPKSIKLSIATEYIPSEDSITKCRRPHEDIIERLKTEIEPKVKNY